MAGATFKVQLKDTPRQDGSHSVRIRITKDRKHSYYTTGINIKLTEWNPNGDKNKNWVRGGSSGNRMAKTYNENLVTTISELWELDRKHTTLSAKDLKERYEAEKAGIDIDKPRGLLAFWQEWIDRKRSLGKEGTAVFYETARSYLLGFTGPDPNESEILTAKFAAAYLAHLRTKTKTKKAYSASTCNEALGQLNTIYKQGVLEGWVEHAGNPFGSIELDTEKKKRLRPTFAQIKEIMALPLPANSVEYDARNCFLLQFFLHGARVSEAVLLEWNQVKEDRVEYQPKKRSKKFKSIPMSTGLKWVLEHCDRKSKFVLPYMREEDFKNPASMLKGIKRGTDGVRYGLEIISKILKLPFTLTSHMARHSFADSALEKGVELRVLQEMLAHGSIRTTEHYISNLKQDYLDQASNAIYMQIDLPKEENTGKTFVGIKQSNDKKRKNQKRS